MTIRVPRIRICVPVLETLPLYKVPEWLNAQPELQFCRLQELPIYKDGILELPFYKEGHHFINMFFPTCQVRVVRFYQSCSSLLPPSPPPSPPPPLHPLPCPLPPCQLFANFRMQWALLDLNCKGLSALGTAGPQPGTFRAQ